MWSTNRAQGRHFTVIEPTFATQRDADDPMCIAHDQYPANGRCDQGMVARIHEYSVGQGKRPAQAEKSL